MQAGPAPPLMKTGCSGICVGIRWNVKFSRQPAHIQYLRDRLPWANSDAICTWLLHADAVSGTLVSSASQPRKSATVARWRPIMTGHGGMCPRLGVRRRDDVGTAALAACHV